MQPVAVDVARGNRAHRHLLRARDDGAEELVAPLLRALLRVVEICEGTYAMLFQRRVVEQDAGDDEWSGERPAPCLVDPCNEPRSEISVELQELLAGPLHSGRQ